MLRSCVVWSRFLSGFATPLRRLLPWTSRLRFFLPSTLGGSRRFLSCLLLEMLADYLVTRLITVTLAAQRMLLLYLTGIPVSRILPLVDRQRGARRSSVAIPPAPSAVTLFPAITPVLAPAGRGIRLPPAKVHGRLPVVAYRDTKDKQRYNLRLHKPPGAVVPGTRVPVVVLVDPVHAVVKEIIAIHLWSIVDRVARHGGEFRVQRQVDPDAHVRQPDTDAHLGSGRSHRADQHPQNNQSAAFILHVILQRLQV